MRKYRPIVNTGAIEIVQNNHEFGFSNTSAKVYRDPKNQISPRAYKVVRSEKILKLTLMLIHYIIMFLAIGMFLITYAPKITSYKILFDKVYNGYLFLFATVAFIAFCFGTKNLIEKAQWAKTIQRYRDAISIGDYASSNTFHNAYRKIVLKDVNLTWGLIFILTYQGIITAIIYGLYVSGSWDLTTKVLEIHFNWPAWLDGSFKNTVAFCIISGSIMIGLIIAFSVIILFDKKRLGDIDEFFGEKSIEIHDQIEKAKKERNKMWLRIYVVLVVLTILLPIAIFLVALWRSIRKKKKSI
ncbi:MSC_0882 family membrane protein [Mycoplasma sp. Mirounga ES2805-ORL]|uniref:MSC_0882 family membrane protein n=1 Tax=Mycoplasma sp. Mirounga ES2805-ORL TaxID=754514 RepID=UPI00197B5D81|nr:hypothetical protein [Mycoplasma sp. Mirounga ES2805-ORL]QSF13749.1 hypothetical protein JXZ90_00400 [Mycoplasma sp. Mirounga ES2805-ORL]